MNDEDIVLRIGKLEGIVESLHLLVKEHMENEEKDRDEMKEAIHNIETYMSDQKQTIAYQKGIIRTLKLILIAVAFIATAQWGDIKKLFITPLPSSQIEQTKE